jgi:hypothetical protein
MVPLSQLAKPGWQLIWQLDAVQLTVLALLDPHRWLQAPQLSTSVVVLVSQPGAAVQSAKPSWQPENVQLPVEQLAPVELGGLQRTPQAAQLLFVLSGVSQPLAVFESQSP